jgi:hypothetical protein
VRQPACHPLELRRIERGQLHHCQSHGAAGVQQLRAQRVAESLYVLMAGLVGGLSWGSYALRDDMRTAAEAIPRVPHKLAK